MSWVWPAIGAGASVLGGIFGGGGEEQEIKPDQFTRNIRSGMFQMPTPEEIASGRYPDALNNVWRLPYTTFGPMVHQGPTPEVSSILGTLMNRGRAPYETAAQGYGGQAISGGFLGSNPALGLLGAFQQPTPNPYLQSMVEQAQRQTAGNVARMFGGAGMGGSSNEQQVATRQLGDIATQMYGRAYETDRDRALRAAQGIGGLWAGERGLQQDVALNAQRLSDLDWTQLRNQLAAAQQLEQYGTLQRQEAQQAHQFDQMAPYRRLTTISNMFSGMPSGQTMQSSVSPNLFSLGLGGALVGAGLYGGMNPGLTAFGASPGVAPYQAGPGYPIGQPAYGRGWS